MSERLNQQLRFLVEIDQLKLIIRQTKLLSDPHRRENDAEHSWHLALYVMILKEYANDLDCDWLKVIKMVVIHDLVEIYAGDVFIYDEIGMQNKQQKEREAAEKLFSILPPDQKQELHELWQAFELKQSPEARFAHVVDRLQPMIHNLFSQDGGTWNRPGITREKVEKNAQVIIDNSFELGQFVRQAIDEAVKANKLLDDRL